MNYIFVSPQFPPNFKYFVLKLRDYGATVLGIGSDDFGSLDPELASALSEYYRVDDMEDYGQVFKAVAYLSYRWGKIDRIESQNEHWLELDARLRTDFNVEGPKIEAMSPLRQKSEMKKVFRRIGIAVAEGKVFDSYEEARRLALKLGYPVIVKPDKGVGAAYTYRLHTEEDLVRFYENKPDMRFIMERYIDADIITYDGLVDQSGNIVFDNSFVYDSGVMDNVLFGKDMYYYTEREIPADLREAGAKCVHAFGLRERFFHIEFFRLSNGSLMALEINVRPPGGMSMDLFNYANEHDFFDSYARIVLGLELDIPRIKPYHVIYIGVKAHNFGHHVLDRNEVLERYHNLIVYHGPIASIFAAAIGHYTYILRSPELKPLLDAAKTILAKKEV